MATDPLYNALRKQALHDHSLASSMATSKPMFPDWTIVISFYMALHCVNAHAARIGWKWTRYGRKDPLKISRHAQTLRFVRKKLGKITFKDYARLYQECWNARYDPYYLNNTTAVDASKLFGLAKRFLKVLT